MTSPLGKLGRQLGSLGDRLASRTASLRRGGRTSEVDAGGGGGSAAVREGGAASKYGALPAGPSATSEEDEGEAALRDLAPGYFDPPEQFDALEHELRQLPVAFEAAHLEAVAEERTGVLEVVSERLSQHVLANYGKFVEGVEEVGRVESDLQAAHTTTKLARERLALALREVSTNLKIAKDTRRKQGLSALLEVLLKLQQANNLQRALKEAQESGEYAEAFWLCAQCTQSMDELGDGLKVAGELTATINRLYSETTQRLEGALAAVCADFRPSHYTKVLEGYMFLGNVGQLGDEVKSAFIATIGSSAAKVVRGVLLTRPGFEEKAAMAANLQELVRFLPSDLFRTCLARVLMVLHDILVSHFHMVRWHEAALERHAAEAVALAAARQALEARLGGSPPAAPAGGAAAEGAAAAAAEEEEDPFGGWAAGGAADELPPLGSPGSDEVTITGRAVMGLQVQLQRGTASELEELEAKASDEAEWGTVLQAVHAGLLSGRKLIWEEAARRIGVLLSSPAAFEGEHFLQVMEWTQRVLAVGESFAGCECASLRTLLERQSGKFFRLYHHSNVEALSSMLDKEVWKRLPAQLPSLAEALAARSSSSDEVGGSSSLSGAGSSGASANGGFPPFEQFVVGGNPWRRQQSPRGRRRQQQLGFGGAAGSGLDDTQAGRALEVDEYGVPRSASNTPSAAAAQAEVGQDSTGFTEDGEADAEPDDVYGDFIDEDTQQVQVRGGGAGDMLGLPAGGDAPPAVTNASWRMYKWMRDYAALMRPLRAAAPAIFAGLCELFELYLLHVFVAFGDTSLAELQAAAAAAAGQHHHSLLGGSSGGTLGGGGPAADAALTPRLRATLLRLAGDSIGKYRQLFAAQPGSKLARALDPPHQAGGGVAAGTAAAGLAGAKPAAAPGGGSSSSASTAGVGPSGPAGSMPATNGMPAGAGAGMPAAAAAAAAAASLAPAAESSVVSNAGNLWGLLERTTAAESLLAVAVQLQRARSALTAALPPGEAPALDAFLSRTVGAAEDLRDLVVRAGARLLLPLRWVPDRLGASNWVLSEPPTGQGAWVDELGRQLELLRDRLAQVPSLDVAAAARLWSAVAAHVADACLEGFSRCKRCSLEGRAAMSLDLQGVGRALAHVLPPAAQDAAPQSLRLVDTYIKAFYIPLGELAHWVQTHAEYTPQQVLALTSCIAESSGLKRKDKAALVAQVEADLRAMGGGAPSSSGGWGGGWGGS
ncbi:hypothetical protein ABPG75_008466 [Micractinium tetrahymenae]